MINCVFHKQCRLYSVSLFITVIITSILWEFDVAKFERTDRIKLIWEIKKAYLSLKKFTVAISRYLVVSPIFLDCHNKSITWRAISIKDKNTSFLIRSLIMNYFRHIFLRKKFLTTRTPVFYNSLQIQDEDKKTNTFKSDRKKSYVISDKWSEIEKHI